MLLSQAVQVPGLAHVVVNPLADLARAVALEAHPDLEAAEAAGLLESVNVVLIALVGLVEFVGQIRRLHSERGGEATLIFDQHRPGIEGSVKPLVRSEEHTSELQ